MILFTFWRIRDVAHTGVNHREKDGITRLPYILSEGDIVKFIPQ